MVESAAPPPLEESWARLQKKMKEREDLSGKQCTSKQKKKNLLSFRLAAIVGIIMLLATASYIYFPANATAVGERIVSTVQTILTGTQANMRTSYKHNEPGQAPPPDTFKEIPIGQERIVSLEEARSVCPFPLAIPGYVPAGYKLVQVRVQEMVKPIVNLKLQYSGHNLNPFVLSETNAPGSFTRGYGYDIEDATVQDVKIGGSTGKMIIFKNKDIKISWIRQGIVYELNGKIPKEEALKIVNSLQ